MPDPFVPHKPEEMVLVKILKTEAVLLQKLRKYAFGKIVVYKTAGRLMRVEITDSQMIEPDQQIDL